MAHKLLLAALLLLILIFYMVFFKQEEPSIKDVAPIPKPSYETTKEPSVTKKKAPLKEKTQQENVDIELKYYNLFLNHDYTKRYNNNESTTYNTQLPELHIQNEKLNSDDDLNIELTPEFNFDKENKELSIERLRLQLEKKF
jgi:hypothetical protein